MSVLVVTDFGAVGDGVTDDLPAFRMALSLANPGDIIDVPNPPNFYRLAADPGAPALTIDKAIWVRGGSSLVFGEPSCTLDYEATDAPVVLLSASTSGGVRLTDLQLRGGQDGIVVAPGANSNRHGGFRSLRILGFSRYGIWQQSDFAIPDAPTYGALFSMQFEDCQVGGNSGVNALRVEETTGFIQSQFRNCRFSGQRTAEAAVFLRGGGPGYDTLLFDGCIFEQNDGPAVDAQGGMKVAWRDCWFEQNCQVFGPDDASADGAVILGGQDDDTGDPLLKWHGGSSLQFNGIFDGCNWSSPGVQNSAAKKRIYFARRGVRLSMRDNRLLGSDVIDGANRSASAGIILQGLTLPTVINWPTSRIYVLGTNDTTIPDGPESPAALASPDVIGTYRGRLRAGRGVTYFPTTAEQTEYNDTGPWPAVIQSVNADGSVNLQVTVPQNQLAALSSDDVYDDVERDMLMALKNQFQTRLQVRQGAKGQKGVYVL